MYSNEENKELIKDIKTPIRTYRITVWGYGGEVAYGKSSKEEYEYWKSQQAKEDTNVSEDEDHENTFSNYMFEKDIEDAVFPNVPAEFQREGEWYDQGDIEHCTGVDISSANIEIVEVTEEDSSETITLDYDTIFENEINVMAKESDAFDHEYVFYGMSVEKGTFFEGTIEIPGKIDLSKLELHTVEFPNGDEIIYDIYYNEEIIDNYGLDTNGKDMLIEIQKLS